MMVVTTQERVVPMVPASVRLCLGEVARIAERGRAGVGRRNTKSIP